MADFNVSLIIPAYNESDRMGFIHQAIREFKDSGFCRFEVILVNDGSTDDTHEKLGLLINRWIELGISARLISYPDNRGKGEALKLAVKEANFDYFLTLDFDMSTNPLELIRWSQLPGFDFDGQTIRIGDRRHKDSVVDALWYRKIAGQIFYVVQRLFTNLKFKDTQCGFKLYPREIGKKLFEELKVTGWSHDIEILMRAERHQIPVINLPVHWVHRKGAKISLFLDGFKMVFQIWRIRKVIKSDFT